MFEMLIISTLLCSYYLTEGNEVMYYSAHWNVCNFVAVDLCCKYKRQISIQGNQERTCKIQWSTRFYSFLLKRLLKYLLDLTSRCEYI